MTRRLFAIFTGYLLSLLFALPANGDTWPLPTTTKYFSADKIYYLEVVPKRLESQLRYFGDKVTGKKNSGAAKGVKSNYCKGTLYKANERGSYRRIRSFPLVNEVSPLQAVISNSGAYIVTFDNWHSAGYGSDVVVIYRSDGSVVRQLALEDVLTENDIEALPTTISSRWWGRDHYIDEERSILVLKIVSGIESERSGSALEGSKFFELRLDLSTGSLIKPKRDMLPRWEAQVSRGVDIGIASTYAAPKPADHPCTQSDSRSDPFTLIRVPTDSLIKETISAPLPAYPPLARAARIEGSVVIEMVVAATGAVSCLHVLSGHPFLSAAAVAVARRWTFRPPLNSDKPTRMIGVVAFHFRYVKIVPSE